MLRSLAHTSKTPIHPDIFDVGLNPYEGAIFTAISSLGGHTDIGCLAGGSELADICNMSLTKAKEAIAGLIQKGVILVSERMSSLEAKETIVSNSSGGYKSKLSKFKCVWCLSDSFQLDAHHYPVRRCEGGIEVVHICKDCHALFHTLTDSPRFQITDKFRYMGGGS
jgi:hypothetical protein